MAADEYTIVGSGLAGTLLACYLGRSGIPTRLFEKRPDPRSQPQTGNRSINLALSVRGLHALRELGLADAVLAAAVLMRGRMIHDRAGRLTFQPYGADDSEALYSVSRAGLNRLLVEAAAGWPNVELRFEQKCDRFDLRAGTLGFTDADGNSRTVNARCVVGADGAFSAVRKAMQQLDRFDFSQDYLGHGYKELSIDPGPDGRPRLEPNALHIWPRGDFMMIALPNADGSFTGTLFWPFDGPHGFSALTTDADVLAYFRRHFPDVLPLIPDLAEQYRTNPTSSLVTIRCHPWHVGDRAVLVGDASHAVVPFLGQGMNAAFEDCTVLMQCLDETPDRAAAFAEYTRRRKPNADVLADLCLANFVEMRDKVGSPLFVLKKKLDVALHRWLGSWYLPLYTMVEFTRIPYAEALRRSRKQTWAVVGVAAAAALAAGLAFAAWH